MGDKYFEDAQAARRQRAAEITGAKEGPAVKLERNHCREAFIKISQWQRQQQQWEEEYVKTASLQFTAAMERLKDQIARDSWMKFKEGDRVKIYGHDVDGKEPLTKEGYICRFDQAVGVRNGPWFFVKTGQAQADLLFHERQLELAPEPKVLYVRQDATFAHGFYILTEEEFAKSERKGEYTKFVEAASG